MNFAIEAIAKIENVIFIIIGDGGERNNLEALIQKYGVAQKVFLLGRIESASMYLKAFDIATLTSITEALPYFLLEAGAAGLPVIASNVGGIPEIIENEATGILMRSKSSDEIKRAIEYALENREKIARFGDELEEKVAHEFNLHDMVQMTVALYEMGYNATICQ